MKRKRPWTPSPTELRIQARVRREAARQAKAVPWKRLQLERARFIRLEALVYWARAVSESVSSMPAMVERTLDEALPGILQGAEVANESGARRWTRLSDRLHREVFADAISQGWFLAIGWYAVRDPSCTRANAYWRYCLAEWKRKRPESYPEFEEWWRASQTSGPEILSVLDMTAEKRRLLEILAKVESAQVDTAVEQYIEWHAFLDWLALSLEADPSSVSPVLEEAHRRYPELSSHTFWKPVTSAADLRRRLARWGGPHLFGKATSEGWFEAVVSLARSHPRFIRLGEYFAAHRRALRAHPHPGIGSFEEWRREADDYVPAAGATRQNFTCR